jgi:hypothetical protein
MKIFILLLLIGVFRFLYADSLNVDEKALNNKKLSEDELSAKAYSGPSLTQYRMQLKSEIAKIEKLPLTKEILGYLPNFGNFPGRTGEEWLAEFNKIKSSFGKQDEWGIQNDFSILEELKNKISSYYKFKYLLKRKVPNIRLSELQIGYQAYRRSEFEISQDSLNGEIYYLFSGFICSARGCEDYPRFLKMIKKDNILKFKYDYCDVNGRDSNFVQCLEIINRLVKFTKDDQQKVFYLLLNEALDEYIFIASQIYLNINKKEKRNEQDSVFFNKAKNFLLSPEVKNYLQIYKENTEKKLYLTSGICRAEKIITELKKTNQ